MRSPSLLAVIAVAALVSAAAFVPGAEAYIDNAPHLVELQALARDALPHGHTGWTEAAQHGFAVGEINGPLAWVPAALLVRAGLDPALVWALGALLANAVFGLGAFGLGRRLWADDRAAAAGAILALTAIPGLYGIGGAIGGMWPWRMALGVLALGLGAERERSAARNALWIAAATLLHFYAGVLACGWAAASALRCVLGDNRRGAAAWIAGAAVAALSTAFFWQPLLATQAENPRQELLLDPFWVILYVFLPFEPMVKLRPALPTLEAGGLGLVCAGAMLAGLGLVARQGLRPRGESAARIAGGAAFIAALVALAGLTDSTRLGPNPWRFLAATQLVLACVAGAGLAAARAERWACAAAVVAALAAGAREIPRKTAGSPWADLEATWADLAAAAPPGQVFHEDTMFDVDAPPWFQRAHIGALLTARTGLPTVGSWYGISPIRTGVWTSSEGPATLGGWTGGVAAWPDEFYAELRRHRIGSVVAVSPTLPSLFAEDPRYALLSAHGPFSAWRLTGGVLPDGPGAGAVRGAEGRLTLDSPGPFEVARTWHAGWTATLNGAPLPLHPSDTSGFIAGEAPAAGVLELRWQAPGPGVGWAFAGLAGFLGLLALPRAPASGAARFTTGRRLLVGAAVHATLWCVLVVPGTLHIDEIGYRLAARAIATGAGLEIRLGDGQLPLGPQQVLTPGFSAQVTEHMGRLVCQYPPGSAILGAPLYATLGYIGLFLLNGLAALASAALTAKLAERWDAPPSIALGTLLLGSFFWEYSLAALPHQAAMALGLGAVLLAHGAAARAAAVGAGLLAAAALTMRLDSVLLAPVVAVVLWREGRARALAWAALGASPLLAGLSAANAWRFGTWNPLSYGVSATEGVVGYTSGLGPHLPVFAACGLLGLGWLVAARAAGGARRVATALTLAGLAAFTVAFGPGIATIVLDMRLAPVPEGGPAITLLDDGAVVYLGHAKKALLQSCPWMVALGLGVPALVRGGPESLIRRPGWLAILTPILFYGAPMFEGGLALHMRYLFAVLPFAAIELAHLARRHPALAGARPGPVWAGALAGVGAGFLASQLPTLTAESLSPGILVAAGLVIGLSAVATTAALLRVQRIAAWLPAVVGLGVGWAGAVALFVDLATHQERRTTNARVSERISQFVEPGGVVIGVTPDPLASLYDRGDVVVASLIADGGAGYKELVETAFAQGRPVYVFAIPARGVSPFPLRLPAELVATARPYRLWELTPPERR